jgi:dipeptidyl aminopeptidase/acylaminoacyl peptidase
VLFALYIISGFVIFLQLTSIEKGYEYPNNSPAYFDSSQIQHLYKDKTPTVDTKDYSIKEFETVTFASFDKNITLSAWYIPAKKITNKAIIIVPGYRESKSNYRQLVIASMLYKQYNVLILDVRNMGLSTFTTGRTTLGNTEYKDILAAKKWLMTRGIKEIGLVGISLGASTSAIAFSYDKDIKAAVLDSPFTSIKNIIKEELARLNIPEFLWFVSYLVGYIFFNTNMLEHDITDMLVKNTGNRNLMFYHANNDKRVLTYHSKNAYKALQKAKVPNIHTWFYDSNQHSTQMIKDSNGYQKRMLNFFDKAFSK